MLQQDTNGDCQSEFIQVLWAGLGLELCSAGLGALHPPDPADPGSLLAPVTPQQETIPFLWVPQIPKGGSQCEKVCSAQSGVQ